MAFKLSDSKSRLLALMGSGILVGTALAIIIPEGIDSIYSNRNSLNTQPSINKEPLPSNPNLATNVPEEPVQLWIIGVSLVAGFVLMLLIDQFSLYQSGAGEHHQHSTKQRHDYTLANQDDEDDTSNNEVAAGQDPVSDDFETTSETKPIRLDSTINNNCNTTLRVSMKGVDNIRSDTLTNHTRNRATPTLGLVIHASADGIALGAAATTSHRDVEMIIFLAIMLHKAPAAFSLVVFLLHRGLKHSTIRRHLLAFSLSAPLAALITYFGLSQSGKEALRRNNATGIAMLFSAGTFLYVATVHVLPELVHNKLLSTKELLFVIIGSFLPILLAQMI